MRRIGVVIIALAGIVVITSVSVLIPAANSESGTVCNQGAKLSPDASYVGRVSENCEFAQGASASDQEVTASGIEGEVIIGPQCPVMRPGMEDQCADKAYQTTLIVETKNGGQEVVRIQTGGDGRFGVILAPGEYIVAPLHSAGPSPNCKMQTVTVEQGQFTPVTIHCDTGIR